MVKEKKCDNCENCDKMADDVWVCEEYGFYYGGYAPVRCDPPYNEACEYWTDDPKKANSWQKRV